MRASSEDSLTTRCCAALGFNGVKTLLIVFNLVFVILGWALIGLGAWMQICQETFYYNALLYDSQRLPILPHDSIPLALLALGILLAVISFVGCVGVYAESVCFLAFYLLILLALVITEIILGSISAAIKEQSFKRLLVSMQHQVRFEYNRTAIPSTLPPPSENGDNSEELVHDQLTRAWDHLQTRLACCGATGPRDYHHGAWFNHTRDQDGLFVPSSCCVPLGGRGSSPGRAREESLCQMEAILSLSEKGGDESRAPSELHSQGCHSAIANWTRVFERVTIGIFVFTFLLQVVDVLFVLLLMKLIRLKLAYFESSPNDDLYCEQREESAGEQGEHDPPPPVAGDEQESVGGGDHREGEDLVEDEEERGEEEEEGGETLEENLRSDVDFEEKERQRADGSLEKVATEKRGEANTDADLVIEAVVETHKGNEDALS